MVNVRLSKEFNICRKKLEASLRKQKKSREDEYYALWFQILAIGKAFKKSTTLQDVSAETVQASKDTHMDPASHWFNGTSIYLDRFEPEVGILELACLQEAVSAYNWKDNKSVLHSCASPNTGNEPFYKAIAAYFHYPSNKRELVFHWVGYASEVDGYIDLLKAPDFDVYSLSRTYMEGIQRWKKHGT